MKDLERKIQELTFDVETQYCDPSDCFFEDRKSTRLNSSH